MKLTAKVKRAVHEACNYECALCSARDVKFDVDHILSQALGGSDEMDNLRLLCKPCHKVKSKEDAWKLSLITRAAALTQQREGA